MGRIREKRGQYVRDGKRMGVKMGRERGRREKGE